MSLGISVIIPACNAADTIAQTLNSLLVQQHTSWEAIVVDDGSTDDTLLEAKNIAARDDRIRVVHQQKSGGSAARNTGIGLAKYDWLLFLDADDWITPEHLHRMCGVLDNDPTLDAVVCGWRYLLPDGTFTEDFFASVEEDMFPQLVRTCAFIIHACIVRKNLVTDAASFDTSLSVCVDWDLWQRVARSGAKFGALQEAHAVYRMRANSVSRSKETFFHTALQILRQGYTADDRVQHPIEKYKNGLPGNRLHEQEVYWACWCAGMYIGNNEDARHLLKSMHFNDVQKPDATWVAENIFDSVCRYTCQHPQSVFKIWPQFENRVAKFLEALEKETNSMGFAKSSAAALTKKVVQKANAIEPFVVGTTMAMRLEVTQSIKNIKLPSTIERLYCLLEMEGKELGTIEVPVFDNLVAAWVLKDVVAQYAWDILLKFLEKVHAQNKKVTENTFNLNEAWQFFLQHLWNRPQWPVAAFYDPDFKEYGVAKKSVKEKIIAIDICDELSDIITKKASVEVQFFLAGIPLVRLRFEAIDHIITAQALRVAITTKSAFELCRICVREALISYPLDSSVSLRERLQQAKKINEDLVHFNKEGYTVIKATKIFSAPAYIIGRYPGPMGSAVYRRASLPAQLFNNIKELSIQAHNVTMKVKGCPSNIQYLPELVGPRVQTTETKKLATATNVFENAITERLPIVKFPAIVPQALITDPHQQLGTEDFEKQLIYLQQNNYLTTTWEDWLHALLTRRPIRGKAIILTFDDATSFFYHAWPLLKQYGFLATLFVSPSFLENETASKNSTGAEIEALQKEGVAIGAGNYGAMPLGALSPLEVVRSMVLLKTLLQKIVASPINIIDYGDMADTVITHLAGACGFLMGLTQKQGCSSLHDDPLQLPVIKVSATTSLDEFVALLHT